MKLVCRPRYPTPCLQYNLVDRVALEDFLYQNGGQILSYDEDGKARFYTHKGSEKCPVFIKPDYWVRAIGPGQFSVCSPEAFAINYETERV